MQTLPLQSNSTSDYVPNLSTAVRKKADLIISAGFLLADATNTVAKKNPNLHFAITDYDVKGAPFNGLKNVEGLTYAANESGCLVGYLAAEMAKKQGGKQVIGAVGGLKIPPVDIWIAGYQHCAKLFNPNIKVLVGYSQDFVASDKCKTVAENQISQGAQVLFQVAGGCGLGTLKAADAAHIWGIGVDKDQYNDAQRVLTSGVKRVDNGVFQAAKQVTEGKFKGGGNLLFNLKNGGMDVGKINPAVPEGVHRQDERAEAEDHRGRGQGPRHPVAPVRRTSIESAAVEASTVLEMRGVTKRFPGVVANDHVDLDLRKGEVHALLGENGAGKSTLMNILYGLYRPDEGEILLNGKKVVFSSAKDAIDRGIGMVHQHFMLIPVMTVAENIVLEIEPTKAGVLLDYGKAVERVREISAQYGLTVDPTAKVESISVGQQQRVEILKALYRDADILILDEPTAVLTPQEAGELFAIIKSLQEGGTSIIFISHKLNEVLEIADRITVLRRGKKIDTVPREGATEDGLAKMMVGREVLLRVDKKPADAGDVLLEVRDLHVNDERGLPAVRDVSFAVRAGEIVGIAGVEGNGQSELIEAITGLRHPESGEVVVAGQVVQRRERAPDARRRRRPHPRGPPAPRPRARVLDRREHRAARLQRGAGVALRLALPEAPRRAGARPDQGVRHPRRRPDHARRLALRAATSRRWWPRARSRATRRCSSPPSRPAGSTWARSSTCTGGSSRSATRAARSCSISLELDEVLSLSDRILVMYEGQVVGEHQPGVTEEEIGLEMLGARRKETVA